MSAAVTRLENSASALGDQIGDQMKTASDNLVGALDKTAMTVGGSILLGSILLGSIGGSMLLGVAITMSYRQQ